MRILALGFSWFGGALALAEGIAPVALAALVALILAVPRRGEAAVCTAPSFGAATTFRVGTNPLSVAVGDFNGDGHVDLAVVNEDDDTVSILLGTGTGSFGAATIFRVGKNPIFVAIGDFNGDGHLDLAVANTVGNTVSILLGTGTGSFGVATDVGVGNNPDSVAIGDFNRDGHLDLAVANYGDGTVSILLGTGTGSFGVATTFGVGNNPVSVAIGDFNGDGALDLAAGNTAGSNTISILLGTGTGSFGAATTFGVGKNPVSVAIGDFNGDGDLDLAVANQGDDFIGNAVSILLGTGTGSFGAATDFSAGISPDSVAVGDFNGDGHLDLAVANGDEYTGISNTVSILLGTGTGSFGTATNFGVGNGPASVAVGDFNRDDELDLAAANQGDDTVAVLLNGCGATPTPTSPPLPPTVIPTPSQTATITVTPTNTPMNTSRPCVGDCDGSGAVTIDELIIFVNIDLGTADASACPDGFPLPNGTAVDMTLIIQAVNNALNGCAD